MVGRACRLTEGAEVLCIYTFYAVDFSNAGTQVLAPVSALPVAPHVTGDHIIAGASN